MDKEFGQIKMDNLINNEKMQVSISIFDVNFYACIENLNIKKVQDGVVCLTGNRPSSLPWQYNESCELCAEFKSRIKNFFKLLINKGYTKFISGLAMGFDIIATEVLLELKNDGCKVFIEGAVPCLNQTKGWKKDYIDRYKVILNALDKVTFTSNYAYFEGCYIIRNKYMVDNSSLVVGCQLKKSSGTKSTLDYALKQNKDIVLIK